MWRKKAFELVQKRFSSTYSLSALPEFPREEFDHCIQKNYFYSLTSPLSHTSAAAIDYVSDTANNATKAKDIQKGYLTDKRGLFTFLPNGTGLKRNILSKWRKYFVHFSDSLEIEPSCILPADILIASGHVQKFTDPLVRDTVNGRPYRADHLIKESLTKIMSSGNADEKQRTAAEKKLLNIEGMSEQELDQCIKEYNILSYDGNPVSKVVPFNMMFGFTLGGSGSGSENSVNAYLRPETAQGIFPHFLKLFEYNRTRLPFSVACIGPAFRNELSPRNQLLRMREFTQAEVEHFHWPNQDEHPLFCEIKKVEIVLNDAAKNEHIHTLAGEAVKKGIIKSEIMAYYMAIGFQFLESIGINMKYVRYRQQNPKELAHYAKDTWDLEILTSHGWVEVAGIANRSCHDLACHGISVNASLAPHSSSVKSNEFVEKINLNRNVIGKEYKSQSKNIVNYIEQLDCKGTGDLKKEFQTEGHAYITIDGKRIKLNTDMVSFVSTKKEEPNNVVPAVIEPSFGIDRILYCVLEHSFGIREISSHQEEVKNAPSRNILSLRPSIAPITCVVIPLIKNPEINAKTLEIGKLLRSKSIDFRVDETGQSVGKRYSRADEMGVPYAITVDFEGLANSTVTVRFRDGMEQIRIPLHSLLKTIKFLRDHDITSESQFQTQFLASSK